MVQSTAVRSVRRSSLWMSPKSTIQTSHCSSCNDSGRALKKLRYMSGGCPEVTMPCLFIFLSHGVISIHTFSY
jgi:hypothetical protein